MLLFINEALFTVRGLCNPLEVKPLLVTLSVPSSSDPPYRSTLLEMQGRANDKQGRRVKEDEPEVPLN